METIKEWTGTHEVLGNEPLAPAIHRLEVRAPRIAVVRQPGQFVIVRLGPGAERIPLTIATADPGRGSITLVVQAVGKSTRDLVALRPGNAVEDVAGPLGRPSDLVSGGHAVCVSGGVGAAVIYPIAEALQLNGTRVTVVAGARSAELMVLGEELAAIGRLVACTEDGSRGRQGLVTDALGEVLAAGDVDVVYAAGPVPMMRAVSELTRPLEIRTIVSLNPVMVDGTGMCGGCRVTVGGETHFACVDGPEFDAHRVDFDELGDRLTAYQQFERDSLSRSVGAEA
jgi:ferredoxin--NADP+ reductase